MTQLLIPRTLESKETGDLVSFFKNYDDIVQRNSGIHDSKCLTIECLEPQCPISEGTFTKIKLSDESVDVVNLNKSWISMRVRAQLSYRFELDEKFTEDQIKALSAIGHNVFVGLKSSAHIIDAYRILNANHKTGCEQTQALYENSIVHFLKPEEEIQGRPNIYTPWENAYHHDQSVCGLYVGDFVSKDHPFWSGETVTRDVEFDLTIPMDDILSLSNISMYPNYLFGNLQMEFRTTSQKNFVWCIVSHEDAYAMTDLADFTSRHSAYCAYYNKIVDKCFYQCGDAVKTPFVYQDTADEAVGMYGYKLPRVTVTVSNLVIVSCQSNINGFRIKDTVKQELYDKYSNVELVIPSQFVDYQQTNKGPSGGALQTSTSYTLTNVSNICVTFPRSSSELTVSRNPRLSAFQIFVDNKPYPEMIGATTSSRYCEYVLSNSYLDNLWCGNKSLLHALSYAGTEFRTDIGYKPTRDNTNYCFNAATERLCSGDGIYCDGLSKDISLIRLYGTLESGQKYTADCPAPHIFFVQTTFWVCTSRGIRYVMNDDEFLKSKVKDDN